MYYTRKFRYCIVLEYVAHLFNDSTSTHTRTQKRVLGERRGGHCFARKRILKKKERKKRERKGLDERRLQHNHSNARPSNNHNNDDDDDERHH